MARKRAENFKKPIDNGTKTCYNISIARKRAKIKALCNGTTLHRAERRKTDGTYINIVRLARS